MSIDSVKKFYQKVEADKGLKGKLEGVGKESLGAVVKIAQSAGFAFSIDDLVAFRQDAGAKELSDADLEMVAGGRANSTCVEAYCGVGEYKR
jgi:predicted ribosomally synthesized peptide with nif11-like leader